MSNIAENNTFEFILDGKTVKAQPGETVLQVATREGITIPSLCFNGKVSHTTSCFVCVVKDCKTGKFLPSCAARPAPGQEIDASSCIVAPGFHNLHTHLYQNFLKGIGDH